MFKMIFVILSLCLWSMTTVAHEVSIEVAPDGTRFMQQDPFAGHEYDVELVPGKVVKYGYDCGEVAQVGWLRTEQICTWELEYHGTDEHEVRELPGGNEVVHDLNFMRGVILICMMLMLAGVVIYMSGLNMFSGYILLFSAAPILMGCGLSLVFKSYAPAGLMLFAGSISFVASICAGRKIQGMFLGCSVCCLLLLGASFYLS